MKKQKTLLPEELQHPHEPENYIYSRYRNPTIVATEKNISKIEGSDWVLLTQSGMAAIDTALSAYSNFGRCGNYFFTYRNRLGR